jgi:TPP-dependent indolepyruvate ferredoxin oxidoreductase alpha subunit
MHALGRAVETILLSVIWIGLPVSPVVASLLAGDLSYVRNYRQTMRKIARQVRAMAKAEVIARRFYNEKRAAEQSVSWKIEGECSHCGECCLFQTCVFLGHDEQGRSKCRIYGNWFFRQLTCAEYPMTKDDIELYACPSFRAEPVHQVAQVRLGRHVIPVVARNAVPDSTVEGGASTRP